MLKKHSSSTFLPEKALLAKRLAQCLTSFLPSGVHLKALETYHIVFKRIGPARLARDIPLYAGGLFPLFSYCSTSLKAPLLSLYETHFLPLGVALSPVLDGFVLAILPGVEDESSEFYIRSGNLLDNIGEAVGDLGVFARSLWRALLLSPPTRLSAAHYLRLKLSADHEDLRAEMVSDMPLVAYAITAALSDTDALTQRSVLDLLLGELALDSQFFQANGADEREAAVAVVGGVFGALIRRDMSLTKRVHAWLLGGKESEDGIAFCNRYSNHLVLAAIDREFTLLLDGLGGKNAMFATRPCRIAAALMDRAELSKCLGHHFALRILKYGRAAVAKNDREHERDIRYAISDLLQDLGSARVFAELERMLASEEEKTHEDFELLTFALSMFPTKNEVVRKRHLPALLRVAVQSLNAVSTDTLTLNKAVAFCSKAMKSMDLSKKTRMEESVSADIKAAVSSFASFFVAWLAHVVEPAPVELRRAYEDVTAAEEYAAELRMASVCETCKECISLVKGACSFFVTAASSGVGGSETLRSSLQALAKCASTADVRISLAGSRAFAEVSARSAQTMSRTSGSDEQVLGVIRRCWRQMHPSLRTATPQSAQALLGLQRRFPEDTKIVIADGILLTDLSRRLRNLERFACLWRLAVEHRLMPLPFDNGLFLMLDALTDEDWAPKMLARSWLSDALEVDSASVLDAPLRLLLTTESRTTGAQHEFAGAYDAPRALYGFQVLRGILESCTTIAGSTREQGHVLHSRSQFSRKDGKRGRTGMRALAGAPVSARTSQALAAVFSFDKETGSNDQRDTSSSGISAREGPVGLSQLLPAHNYVITVALTCLGYLRGRVPARYSLEERRSEKEAESVATHGNRAATHSLEMADDDFEWLIAGLGFKSLTELHAGVCAAAAECLATLFRTIPVPSQMSSVISNLFAEPVLTLVKHSMDSADPVLQLHFLNAIAFLVTADGPCYLSSVQGKEAFMNSETSLLRLSYSESQNQLLNVKPADSAGRGIQVGAVESLTHFVPWLLEGVLSTCRAAHSEHDSGSNEVLGLRRRWIQFMETVMCHIGVTLPVVTEGLLTILSELLRAQNGRVAAALYSGDSEFSRVDETLVLLEGITVVTSNVLWSFEYALSSGDLKDDSHSNVAISDGSVLPHAGPIVNDAFFTVKGENRSGASRSGQESGTITDLSRNGHVGNVVQTERTSNVTATTTAMINAINPLRMINDFVKDVLSGTGSEGAHRLLDPRRSGARILFSLLPGIVENIAKVWGPLAEGNYVEASSVARVSPVRDSGAPRLSTELPRERRQAQRASVIAILEPIFELRPTDVVASVIALFCSEQNDVGVIGEERSTGCSSRMACQMLHAMDDVSPDIVISSVKSVFESAVKWDPTSADAKEGKSQASLRQRALQVVRNLVRSNICDIGDDDIKAIGRLVPGETGSALPGGTIGLELNDGVFHGANGPTAGHQDLFHWGDYFAVYAPGRVETACFNVLDFFFASRRDAGGIHNAFPLLHALLKDALSTGKRKATAPAVLRVLGTFVSRCPSPFPERKIRRDVMTLAVSAISSCSYIASGHGDISSDELSGHQKDLFKRELSVVALGALASTLPTLVDSSFLEDKPQLSSTVTASLVPAVAALKKGAARASSIHIAAESSKHLRGSVGDQTPKHKAENTLDMLASKAATDVILQVSNRDWGVKFARRELLTLLEDSNFFFGKQDGVLEKTSAIVREVVAGGGAATLLSSIGSSSMNGAPGIPSLFTGRDSETVLRARAIRRVAFCVFVSEPDFYSPQLPSVLERLRDALRMADAGLVVECLLCLRALLLRIGPSSISAFRATTLSEIFRIASNPRDDLNATVAALRFLDLTTLLSPADYGYERCFFFGEQSLPDVLPGIALRPFQPLATRLSTLWREEQKTLEKTFTPPLRLEGGRTVLPGNPPSSFDEEFVGRYAAALVIRNSMPKMRATPVDTDTICRELEQEFVR